MMKTVNKLMLVGLLAIGGSMNAGQQPNPQAQPNQASQPNSKSPSEFIVAAILTGVGTVIAEKIIVGGYEQIKDYFSGESAKKEQKEEAASIDKEIEIEGKKINLAITEGKTLTDHYQALVLLYNGGNNTGLDKKEIQAEIKKVWEAMKANSAESALVINKAKTRIAELEQKRSGIKAQVATTKPQTLAQATQLPTVTRQMTPELAAKLSPARAA